MGDESATDKDSITNNFQWTDWDTSEESKQGEESPRGPHPRTVHTLTTEEIADDIPVYPLCLSTSTQPLTNAPGSPLEPRCGIDGHLSDQRPKTRSSLENTQTGN